MSFQPSYFRSLEDGSFEFLDHRGAEIPTGWQSCYLDSEADQPPGCECDCAKIGNEETC